MHDPLPRRAAALLLASLAITAVAAARLATRGGPSAGAEALYLEDADMPRPVAHVAANVSWRAGARRLHVRVSACGVGVEPFPGVAGVAGGNRRTAEELTRLLDEGALRLVTRVDGEVLVGEIAHVERGHVSQRRWRPDGGVERAPDDGAPLVVAVTFVSAALPDGASQTFVEVSGVPRLRVAHDGRALAVTSLREVLR